MELILEGALALALTVAILVCVWLAFGRLFTPVGPPNGPGVWAVVRAEGDGADLEQTVNALLWLRGGFRGGFSVIIADGGLSEDGRAIARALTRRSEAVRLCPVGLLSGQIQNGK